MPRFFVDMPPESEFFLGGEAGRHGAKVLRLRPGETVILCDGQGFDYPCRVAENTGDGLFLAVTGREPSRSEPKTSVTICQCLPKSDKLETVVQKCVELGAVSLRPIESRYCVTRWDSKTTAKKLARLQKIALEAAMQSGRGIIPQILSPTGLRAALQAAVQEGEVLFFYEKATAGLKSGLSGSGSRLFLFVGPEGGFSEEEAALAESLGAKVLSLGSRILRTETAPIAALSAILYEKGDMDL